MVGQNIGAGQKDRARSIVNWCLVMNFIIEAVLVALVQLFAAKLIGVFDSDPEVINFGVTYLRFMTFSYFAVCFMNSYLAMANGVGFSALSFIACTFDGAAVISGAYYYSGRWRKRSLIAYNARAC